MSAYGLKAVRPDGSAIGLEEQRAGNSDRDHHRHNQLQDHGSLDAAVTRNLERTQTIIPLEQIAAARGHSNTISICRVWPQVTEICLSPVFSSISKHFSRWCTRM